MYTKHRMLQNLMGMRKDGWRVIGITEAALKKFIENDFERPKTLDESRGELLKEILMKEFLLKQKHKAEIEDLWKPYKDIENA